MKTEPPVFVDDANRSRSKRIEGVENMTLHWWKSAAWIAALGVFGSGCIINVSHTRNTYESCGTGDVCNGASNCTSVTVNGVPGAFCTQSCSSDAVCPSRLGHNGSCFMGTCFQKCSGPGDCGLGMTCTAVAQGWGTINLCVPGSGSTPPCGAINQSCCAGATCNDPNAACASDGICKPKVYLGCDAASAAANEQCTDALTPSGFRVQSTCLRPPFTNAGPTGFCSLVCNGDNNSCPQPIGGTAGCYIFTGMTQPMCFIDCPTNPNLCPTGTECVMLTSRTGAAVRVCAPPVAR
jgi:hypothetical protein